MDKMVKVGKFIIGGFVALIVIGLFMPSTPSTASNSPKQETKTKSIEKSYAENEFFDYVHQFVNPDLPYNFDKSKKYLLESAYTHCENLKGQPLIKTDPYGIWTSIEISPLWFGVDSGAIIYLCPEYRDGLSAFTDTMNEKSLDKYLIESYPSDEMYTDSDRAESKAIIMRNFAYVGSLNK